MSFIHNSAMHFQGLPRTAGAVLIGSAGIRSFCPNHVASAFMSVGGMSILLSLVAMAANLEELYSALKALTCIVQSSKIARKEMVRVKGYQVIGLLQALPWNAYVTITRPWTDLLTSLTLLEDIFLTLLSTFSLPPKKRL